MDRSPSPTPPPPEHAPCDISCLAEVWPRVRASVMAAVDMAGGTHTERDVIDILFAGRAVLWANGNSGVVCEIDDFPQMRVCRYWAAGGSLDDLLPMEAEIEAWARGLGCRRMVILGRAGWAKKLGFDRRGTWMTKDLQ